jgi:branched-chain amino acid aminotransferase
LQTLCYSSTPDGERKLRSFKQIRCKIASAECVGRGGKIMATVPFDKREGFIWMDGKLIPWADAQVHVLTHALHYGSSVFEGERAYGGKIFECRKHSERLIKSAAILDMEVPFTAAEIDAAKKATLKANKQTDAYVRPIVWRGSETMGVAAQSSKIHLAVATWEWPSYFDPAQRMKGIRLGMAEYRRPDPKTAPSEAKAAGLYMICTISKHKAEREGFNDALMLDWKGRVAECTGANIFFIKDGVIHTPKADCFLDGITRRTVIKLARKNGMKVVQRRIKPEELSTFNECFITGTAAEVTPVGEIAGIKYTPGNMTKTLIDAYSAAVTPK